MCGSGQHPAIPCSNVPCGGCCRRQPAGRQQPARHCRLRPRLRQHHRCGLPLSLRSCSPVFVCGTCGGVTWLSSYFDCTFKLAMLRTATLPAADCHCYHGRSTAYCCHVICRRGDEAGGKPARPAGGGGRRDGGAPGEAAHQQRRPQHQPDPARHAAHHAGTLCGAGPQSVRFCIWFCFKHLSASLIHNLRAASDSESRAIQAYLIKTPAQSLILAGPLACRATRRCSEQLRH